MYVHCISDDANRLEKYQNWLIIELESPESAKYDNYVTYTGKYTVHVITVIEKTIEEFFTLCPGLLLLADLVF